MNIPMQRMWRRGQPVRWLLVLCFLAVSQTGCLAVRMSDHALPSIRMDRPGNEPVPPRDSPQPQVARARWEAMAPVERRQFPTPYHAYVDAPMPGTFEGPHAIGWAFSGGGVRGMVFNAACLVELERLGDILVEVPGEVVRIDLVGEADYVSGVSTGAIPAAVFALNFGSACPPAFRFDAWPECLNQDLQRRAIDALLRRPHRLVRDMVFAINTRPCLSGVIAATFFGGRAGRLSSGLTFGDLPRAPILLIGASVISDPGAPLIQTRLPYRYALDSYPPVPWVPGIQTFESFGTDPMRYPLGEASYNSSSFPGNMRSGLLRTYSPPEWVFDGVAGGPKERLRRSQAQPHYKGIYEIKDGGLVDNRGGILIGRLFASPDLEGERRPVLIGLDAGFRELRTVAPGRAWIKKGWLRELTASNLTSWQTGQEAYEELTELLQGTGAFDYVRFRFTDWCRFVEGDGPEHCRLEVLCREDPAIRDPGRLLEISRTIGTRLSALDEEQMAAVKLCARFAVWLNMGRLLEWASACHGGGCAAFEHGDN